MNSINKAFEKFDFQMGISKEQEEQLKSEIQDIDKKKDKEIEQLKMENPQVDLWNKIMKENHDLQKQNQELKEKICPIFVNGHFAYGLNTLDFLKTFENPFGKHTIHCITKECALWNNKFKKCGLIV